MRAALSTFPAFLIESDDDAARIEVVVKRPGLPPEFRAEMIFPVLYFPCGSG